MTYINVFLASSVDELQDDRTKISAYIGTINNQLVRQGFYVKLYTCETEDQAMAQNRKQDEYNEFIRNCDLIVVLFFKHIGEYTEEELNVAYEQFKTNGKPQIMVFFRNEGIDFSPAIRTFQTQLEEEKKLNFHVYNNIDLVKQSILMWVRNKFTVNLA